VKAERDALVEIVEEVNRDTARRAELYLELARWETDTRPGFHVAGPQGLIDPILRIADCELVIGIFWSRLGTPTSTGETGTEHEFRMAYEAWQENHSRPEIMAYFCERPPKPKSDEDRAQIEMLKKFKSSFPREGFSWGYKKLDEFKILAARHLRQYVGEQIEAIWNKDALLVREMLEARSNEPTTIAILGRLSSRDPRYDKPIANAEGCKQALQRMGRELALAGCRLMVYDSQPEYAAAEIVRGYVESGAAISNSIRIRRPLDLVQDAFPGQAESSHLFLDDPVANEQWEVAFIPSLSETDGVLMVGNGQFTLLGGLQAVGAKLPILALAGYGGITRDVWEVLKGQRYRFANDQEVAVMAARNSSPDWAAECIRILLLQKGRRNALQIWRA
jgi:hypothetical protein